MNHPNVERVNNVNPFLQRKNDFFMDKAQNRRAQAFLAHTQAEKDNLFATIENEVSQIGYTFLNEYKSIFEKECNVALNSLNLNKEEDADYLLWCYFCACMQEQYHKDYRQKREAQAIQDGLKAKIKQYAYDNQAVQIEQETLLQKIKDFAIWFVTIPLHLSEVRYVMGLINTGRLQWIYVRSILKEVLLYARKEGIWDSILNSSSIFKDYHIDIDDFIGVIEHPDFKLALFIISVAFFAARLLIVHLPLILQHSLNPTERAAQINGFKRAWAEIKKRHPSLINDLAWCPINFITNFNNISGLSDFDAGVVTGAFLVFDAAVIFWCYESEKAEYLDKWNHFDADIKHHEVLLAQEVNPNRRAQIELCLKNARNDRLILENNWRAQQNTYIFVLGAAGFLSVNFSIGLFAGPVGVIICYAMCSIATAMYMSSNEFKTYQEKKYALEYAGIGRSAKEMQLLNKDFEFARLYFIATFLEHLILPALTIGLYAACWPMAVALTVAVLSYKFILKPTLKHRHEEEMKLLENEIALETHRQYALPNPGNGGVI